VTSRRSLFRLALVTGTLGALLGLVGCGSPSGTPTSPTFAKAVAKCTASGAQTQATVEANSSFRFSPEVVCLRVGGTVTWTNTTTSLDHTSTDEPSQAASADDATIPPGGHGWSLRLPSGHSASLTFKTAGVYHYFCIPHETLGMVGVVVVIR